MNNDEYKSITIISLLILLIGVIIYEIKWLLPPILIINGYTYYKRLIKIPKGERFKAASSTIISIVLICILFVSFLLFKP